MTIFTIGHSNHSIEEFLGLLKQHKVTAVADVRSNPYSRRFPHFNQAPLRKALKTADIAYVFLGDYLGARSNDRSCYVEGKARYELIAATEAFATGLDRIVKGAERHKITLMCAEQDPIICHRAILICPYLQKIGLGVQHILKAGKLESHERLEERLLKLHNLDQMFPLSQETNEETAFRSDETPKSGEQLLLFDTKIYDIHSRQPDAIVTSHCREELIQKAYELQGEQIAYVEGRYRDRDQSHERVS